MLFVFIVVQIASCSGITDKHGWIEMHNDAFGRFGWLLRFPFTLLLLATVTAVAVLTNSHVGDLSAHWQRRLGMSARDVWNARWPRIFTARKEYR